jgi:hypothetical protein
VDPMSLRHQWHRQDCVILNGTYRIALDYLTVHILLLLNFNNLFHLWKKGLLEEAALQAHIMQPDKQQRFRTLLLYS